MPLYISIRFLTGRAHLHHWHAHHSDGKVDWPPSPWRLLRALVAAAGTGLTSLPEPLDATISDAHAPNDPLPVSRLADVLAIAALPKIWLPRTGGGHTRQFLPKKQGATGSAVFDTFATVSKETPIVFEWVEVNLPADDQRFTDLQTLLRRLTYFGRAESWCDATAHTERPPGLKPDVSHWCCLALEPGAKPEGREHMDYTLERKLAPVVSLDNGLRGEAVEMLSALDFKIFETKTVKKTGKTSEKWVKATPAQLATFKQALAEEPEGLSLVRCLLRSCGEDIKDGLERPIGSRWIHYAVPRAIHQLPQPRITLQPRRAETPITLVRFALNTATVNRPVLPPLTDTLLFADKFRAAALAWHGHLKSGEHPRNLCGRERDDAGERRIKGHNHAFFWPTDENNDGLIDHVSVYCPHGFLASEADALRRLLRIGQRGGRPDLLVTPVFLGAAADFGPWKWDANVFVSATPYYCPVNLSHGKNSGGKLRSIAKEILRSLRLTHVVQTEAEVASIHEIVLNCAADVLPEAWTRADLSDARYLTAWLKPPDEPFAPGTLAGLQLDGGTRQLRALAFCRRCRQHFVEGAGRMFRIEFANARPAQPFSLGGQCHFGLGLFQPIMSSGVAPLDKSDSAASIRNQSKL
jgi:CRISPR-associated protein Csb2